VISASGTLGQIIPPSIVLIILGDMMGLSVGELFAGAMLPGLVLVGLYILFVLGFGFVRPDKVPAGGGDGSEYGKGAIIRSLISLLPALFLVVAVLGSILVGLASPTEAAGVGAAGALVLTIGKRKFTFTILRESLVTATRLCSMVFMVLVAATAFGLVFRGLGGDELIKTFFLGIGGNKWGILAIIMGMLFFLGFFLDIIEIIFIVIPLLLPIIETLGFNMLWVGVLIAVNFQTSFLTPPIGFSLFFLRGVCPPSVNSTHIYRGVMPFIVLQLIGLTLIILFPSFVTWLPGIFYK
jgi:tripartite ATP-independent transporter DctM subunit